MASSPGIETGAGYVRSVFLLVLVCLFLIADGCELLPFGDTGCLGEGAAGKIVFESLRDAPSSPADPNYDDYLSCYLKYQRRLKRHHQWLYQHCTMYCRFSEAHVSC